MIVLKFIVKIIVIPVMLAITLLQWIGIFLIGFSSVIFNLFAGLCFMIAVLSYLMQLCTGMEALQMLTIAFVVFLIPHIGEWIVTRIASINYGLRNFIRS